jgi:site-specific DNA-methyltransferase (adenine-specific)
LSNQNKQRAPLNRTITLSDAECRLYEKRLLYLTGPATLDQIIDKTICQDTFKALDWLPAASVDLVFADPPYNLNKTFNERSFSKISSDKYQEWLESWLSRIVRILKPAASIYICGDWQSSAAIHKAAEKYFTVRNCIAWEREKGRGSKKNWKNCSENIWFCTVSDHYYFNADAVKLKRKVLAPYTLKNGEPKDWQETNEGRFRTTYPSNIWTDITVPFWSMRENTNHPTQKPEKLLAKIILASSRENDVVFDPFAGAGTTAVTAKKLKRHFISIEIDKTYCCLAEKRLKMAEADNNIQGYINGYFWERNTLSEQRRNVKMGKI